MQHYTYLLIDFFTVVVCFSFSFHRKIGFHKKFGAFLKAAGVVAIPFLLWDIAFNETGVWWFNDTYLTGFRIAGLPIEEILFFLCIPFSCVFTYYCLDKFFGLEWANGFNTILAFITFVICTVVALLHYQQTYTFVTALATISCMFYLHFVAKVAWIGQASISYIILMPGFLVVNGLLTGTGLQAPIVNYNPYEFLNIRILTIPIEDAVYGYTQFLLTLYFFKMFDRKDPKSREYAAR